MGQRNLGHELVVPLLSFPGQDHHEENEQPIAPSIAFPRFPGGDGEAFGDIDQSETVHHEATEES